MSGERGININKILFLEDDSSLTNGLIFTFKKQDHEADIARTLGEAGKTWSDGKYGPLILDVSLPDGFGPDFCEMMRQIPRVPIIFLTAPDEETSIIMGLDMNGGDYTMKPLRLGVLIPRINTLLCRVKNLGTADTELQSNEMRVLPLQGQVYKNGERLELTVVECKLLCFLMRSPNTVLSKGKVLNKLWDCEGDYIDNNILIVYARRLRTKIEDNPGEPQMIVTARRTGYKWNTAR